MSVESPGAPDTKLERLSLSTAGEVKEWLANESVGADPYAASYLEKLRSIVEFAEANKTEGDVTLESALTLAGSIGRMSEKRIEEGGAGKVEIPGVVPVREVTAFQIMHTGMELNPDTPIYKGYVGSEDQLHVHNTIDQLVREEMPIAQEAIWTEPQQQR